MNGGVVVALGSDEEIRDFVRPFTRVVNLHGRLAIPAFGDAHVHPVQGGLESLRCNLAGLRTRQEYLDTIAAYASALPPGAWVLGGGWSMSAFPGGTPNAADLDMVTGGRPAFLPNRDHHSCLGEHRGAGGGRGHRAHPGPGRRQDRARPRRRPGRRAPRRRDAAGRQLRPAAGAGRADRRAARRAGPPALARHHLHPGCLRRRRGRARHARRVRHLPARRRRPPADLPGDRGAVVGQAAADVTSSTRCRRAGRRPTAAATSAPPR